MLLSKYKKYGEGIEIDVKLKKWREKSINLWTILHNYQVNIKYLNKNNIFWEDLHQMSKIIHLISTMHPFFNKFYQKKVSAWIWRRKYNFFYKHSRNPFSSLIFLKMFAHQVLEVVSAVRLLTTRSILRENSFKKWRNKNRKKIIYFFLPKIFLQKHYYQVLKVKVNFVPLNINLVKAHLVLQHNFW